jgi:hypothetical protein
MGTLLWNDDNFLTVQQEKASNLHGIKIILIAQQENASNLHGMIVEAS